MASTPVDSAAGYEFNESQNQLLASLGRKMSLVGFMMIFFGALQLFNGIGTLFMSRNPARVVEAAKKAGMSEDQLSVLSDSLSGGIWSSPLAISALAFALAGFLLLLVGIWTRQAAGGFFGIAMTKGQDIPLLIEALGALYRKYTLIYNVILAAAIISLVSLGMSLWHSWRG